MDTKIQALLQKFGPILCIDIGAQTQKAILARPHSTPENWPRFLLPSPACLVAQRIYEASLLHKDIWLYGQEMGGGFSHAVRNHLQRGLKAYATEEAARSLHDNPEIVANLGVTLTDRCPPCAMPIHCSDFTPEFWNTLLRQASLSLPHLVLAAVQDHGAHMAGNREGRHQYWRKLLATDPMPISWIYDSPPENMTRLGALHAQTGGPVADTATAAILGSLANPVIAKRCWEEGVTFLNIGNQHSLGALIYKNRVYAIFEHHAESQSPQGFLEQLKQFKLRWLPPETVHAEGGTGPAYVENSPIDESFDPVFITGPRRDKLINAGITIHDWAQFTGCEGLLYGFAASMA